VTGYDIILGSILASMIGGMLLCIIVIWDRYPMNKGMIINLEDTMIVSSAYSTPWTSPGNYFGIYPYEKYPDRYRYSDTRPWWRRIWSR